MTERDDGSTRYGLPSLKDRRVLTGLGVIGAIVALSAAAFAFTAGWLTPGKTTPGAVVNALEAGNGGPHTGFRRNHAKGVCVTGSFDGSGAATHLSRATLFASGAHTPVVGRFALAGGMPEAPDTLKNVRSFALSFRPASGGEWRTGMNAMPVFVVRDGQGFYDQLLASAPDPVTGKPNPDKMKAFLGAHPETAAALKLVGGRAISSAFADSQFNSLNAFRFVSAAGTSTAVRWSVVPIDPVVAGTDSAPDADKTFLFDALAARIAKGPVQWHLVVTIAGAGDTTSDSTVAWPEGRETVDAGTLTIDHIAAEGDGNCRDINYDPLVLPDGIAPSDDPILSARSAAYARSYTRREGEAKTPSAVQVKEGTP